VADRDWPYPFAKSNKKNIQNNRGSSKGFDKETSKKAEVRFLTKKTKMKELGSFRKR